MSIYRLRQKTCHRAYAVTKALFSLDIHAVWSGHLLSANRITGYYREFEWRAWMILYAYAGWRQSALVAHARRHIFAWLGPYKNTWTDKVLARLGFCTGSPEPLLVTYVISTISSCAGAIISYFLTSRLNQFISMFHCKVPTLKLFKLQ